MSTGSCPYRYLKHNHIYHYRINEEGKRIDENSSITNNNGCYLYESFTDDPLFAYWLTLSILLSYRLFVTYTQLRIALYLHSMRKKNNIMKSPKKAPNGNNNNNNNNTSSKIKIKHKLCFGLPLTTVFEAIHTIVLVIMVFMVALYDELDPIYAYFLLGLTIGLYLVSLALSCRKLINLGQRVLPRSLRSQKKSMGSSIFNDKLLALYYITLIVSNIVGSILLLIVAPALYNTIYAVYGLGFQGISVLMGVFILIRQGVRVVNFMKESNNDDAGEANIENNDGSGAMTLEERKAQINKVIFRMFYRTLVVFIAGSPSAISLMLIGFVGIPNSWRLLALNIFGSTTSSFASTLMFLPRDMSLLPCSKPRRREYGGSTLSKTTDNRNSNISAIRSKISMKTIPQTPQIADKSANNNINNDMQ